MTSAVGGAGERRGVTENKSPPPQRLPCADRENHTKKHRVVTGSVWRESVYNRGLTWSERSSKVFRESEV